MHSPRWISRFHSDERQVPNYREGNVFLAGDAAHCLPGGRPGHEHRPPGRGQPLLEARRGAPRRRPELLDSYNDERHPVGTQVLRSSGAMIRLAAERSRVKAAIGGLAAAAALHIKPLQDKAMGMISGVGIRYGHDHGENHLVGHRAADRDLAGGPRLYEALRGGRFVVLDSAEKFEIDGLVTSAASADPDGKSKVVRPDGYIGWAGDDDPEAIRAYLTAHAGHS
ncbi:hypothetical protein GCM10029992_56560 [Glycomyces albus]